MKKPIKLLILVFILLLSKPSFSQTYISYDAIRDYMRVNIGATQWSIAQQDSAARNAVGIHLSNEAKIVSAFVGKKRTIAVHDAFYFDINLGALTSTQNTYKTETESKFSLVYNFGYLGLIGYRNKQFGALAGIDFRWMGSMVGGLSTGYAGKSLVLRGEYCLAKANFDKRAIAMVWYGNADNMSYQSIRLEYPLGDECRWWLCGQYTHQTSKATDDFRITDARNSSFNQLMLGLRIGYLP